MGNVWSTRIVFGGDRTVTLGPGATDWVVVNAVNAAGAISPDAVWRVGTP
jgi:hypothetical protein